MKTLFKIGEIAELFHLNVKTLRYYDEIDLVKPESIDEETGYRYYSTAQFEQLNTIRYLRELDVPLEEIRAFLNNRETGKIENILKTQIRQVEEKQQQLETVKKKLSSRIQLIKNAKTAKRDVAEIRHIPARRALLLKYSTNPDSDLEYPIRLLAKDIPTASVFLGKIGLSIDAANLEVGRCEKYDYIFLLLDPDESTDELAESQTETVKLKGGKYAIIRFQGTHKDAEKNYKKLMRFIEEEGYCACGNSLEITLIDAGFTTDVSQYVTEIQIPIKKC